MTQTPIIILGLYLQGIQNKPLNRVKQTETKRQWSKANWVPFAKHIQESKIDISYLGSAQETFRAADVVTMTIKEAIEKAVPKCKEREKYAPWWTPNLSLLQSRIRQTRRRIRKTHREEDIVRLKVQLEGWNTAVQRAKERYWHEQLAETNQQTVWKVIRKHNAHYKPIHPLNGVSTFEGKCQVLRTALFPDPAIQISDLAPDTVLSKCDLRKEFSATTSSEIWNTLKRCKTDTAPGPDQITYSTIRTFHSAVPVILPALFNAIYKYEIIPDEWKASNCVVIPKEGKSDYIL
jgi:hypothetical protein